MTRLSSAPSQAIEVTRFRTLAGDFLRYTQVLRIGIGQYEIRCSGCGQAGWEDKARTAKTQFKFQSDAITAARTHAKRCIG